MTDTSKQAALTDAHFTVNEAGEVKIDREALRAAMEPDGSSPSIYARPAQITIVSVIDTSEVDEENGGEIGLPGDTDE
ncbi:hypothetical protein GCM10008959_39550 [Deinococcus seoulensis]|uniref:Uncharacterized protein n=1 Tax=Deinococcus seoulensis TaxID=1837379 RepID=A0ABQ2RY00_9DEIO|nr:MULTISPECIES: hypothetical protein [Deinococcus]MCD0163157.1 hypothetical protein [Deinococcus sp. 6YEL10]MCD0165676.1 hypothetical protein [Deinococcus sp. 12RED42]MCD0175728.1 hypothetical protein [Deinococcus sp. 14RED07]GGR74379.1 hypothetical protein GCM10008959_39550 [Deinococcus seoulensis]